MAEAVKVELATTAAVLLEAKFPYTAPNTFALLSLPAFVEEMEADEFKISASNTMFSPTAEAKSDRMETVDEEEEKLSATAVAKRLEEECCKVLCSWLEVATRRMVAAQALAVMYRVIASGTGANSVANSATSLTTPLDEMTKAYVGLDLACFRDFFLLSLLTFLPARLNDAELTALPDFDFINALLESIRDICLFQQKLAASTLEGAFKAMSTVVSRLEVS